MVILMQGFAIVRSETDWIKVSSPIAVMDLRLRVRLQ